MPVSYLELAIATISIIATVLGTNVAVVRWAFEKVAARDIYTGEKIVVGGDSYDSSRTVDEITRRVTENIKEYIDEMLKARDGDTPLQKDPRRE